MANDIGESNQRENEFFQRHQDEPNVSGPDDNDVFGSLYFTPEPIQYVFNDESGEIGKFWFDKDRKEWRFEGQKAKSAMEFVAWCLTTFRQQLREEYGLTAIQKLVDEQAEDEGLWFIAETAPEGYLQAELRKLHQLIEGDRK
ncbi:MAG TPA: hypothetical protein VMW50_09150 [Dehalococcoidia bacterium]|jgi:hypothetical protein|nr:hypothetical protein [Dehalococcoidia bacterium]